MPQIDSSEFGRIFVEYRDRFVALADSYVHDRAVSEDIVADAFAKFWDARDGLDLHSASPQVYILSMVRNRCLNHLRDRAARQKIMNVRLREDMAALENHDASSIFSSEINQALSRFLDSIPADRREIFCASRFEGLSHNEIALRYGYTPRKVRREIGKALETLREILGAYL